MCPHTPKLAKSHCGLLLQMADPSSIYVLFTEAGTRGQLRGWQPWCFKGYVSMPFELEEDPKPAI